MTDPIKPAAPRYHVSYSGFVQSELRQLGERAKRRGRRSEFLIALQELDRRLHIYPQFGEPLRDLIRKPLIMYLGIVAPLVVQYVIDESTRVVLVATPIRTFSKSGLD